jgi:TolB-like protein/DNA-binding winged helix-turn-helix (wHTH) protein/Flp pilus assembly protein TadD
MDEAPAMDEVPERRTAVSHGHEFCLGALRIDLSSGQVEGPGGRQQLDPKVAGVLAMLVRHAGSVVSREDLLARLWPNVVVTDDAVSRCVYELRRQLTLAGGGDEYRTLIETLPKRGYRLNGEPRPAVDAGAAPEPAPAPAPPPAALSTRRVARWTVVVVGLIAAAFVGVLLSRPLSPHPGPVTDFAIAVLPFADLSESGDQQYFADGMSEEIIHRLSRFGNLRVMSRTSSFLFRERPLDVTDIASRLKVTHVLEGSVRKSGERVRVTAQLIDRSGAHVWSEVYERELGDVFTLQDEVAAGVAAQLQATLDSDPTPRRQPSNLAAYELVLQGEDHYYRRGPGDVERSIELFEEATRIEPGYARAWADLAGAYSIRASDGDPRAATWIEKQGDAARRAVELDPSLALAHARLAQYFHRSGDDGNARRHFERAKELDPNDTLVLGFLAGHAARTGAIGQAIALQRRALLRDPMNTLYRLNLAIYLVGGGQLDEALANFRALLELRPDAGHDVALEIARILVLKGQYDAAAAAALDLPAGRQRDHVLALLHPAPAHRAAADAALARLTAAGGSSNFASPQDPIADTVRIAEVHASRDQVDQAFVALERQRDELASRPEGGADHLEHLRLEMYLSPFMKPLHADPRWAAFVANDT